MKRIMLALVLLSVPVSLFAQEAENQPIPHTKRAYYIKDGEKHDVWMLEQEEKNSVGLFVAVSRKDSFDATTLTPDQISEYGFDDGKSRYISARVETEEGEEWMFFKFLLDMDDKSRIVYLTRKSLASKTDVYYRLEGDRATKIGTSDDSRPMLELYAAGTGFSPSDGKSVRFPKRLTDDNAIYYHRAYSAGNDKMFPRNYFGVKAGYGRGLPWNMIDNSIRHNYGNDFSLGVYTRLNMGGDFSFQIEVLWSNFSNTGVWPFRTAGDPNIMPKDDTELKSNMISIPWLTRFRYSRLKSKWMPYIELGPVLYARFVDFRYYDRINYEYIKTGASFKSFGGGYSVGAGAEYYINADQALWFGLRTTYLYGREIKIKLFEFAVGFSIFNF